MSLKSLLTFCFLLLILLLPVAGQAQDFPDVCQEPGNILRNCNFNNGLEHWQTYTQAGAASFSVLQGGGECHAPLCPAAYIVTDDHFVGGLYQQVPVTPGAAYYANIVWLVFDSLANDSAVHQATGGIGRQIGLDPTGGTDPNSPNIVWSPENWNNHCKICNIEHVTVQAQAETITLFLRIDDRWRLKAAEAGYPVPGSSDKFWIDDMGLKQVGEAAPLSEPTPTETPVPPPTAAPVAEVAQADPQSPVATPTATPQPATPTPEPSAEPTIEDSQPTLEAEPVSPVATPTSIVTNTPPPPPPTLTPTTRPTSTPTRRARPTATRERSGGAAATGGNSASGAALPVTLGAMGATACFGGVILLVAALILFGLVWLYRLGWGQSDDNEFEEIWAKSPE